LVGSHKLLGGSLVDDDSVHLAVDQGLHGGGAVVIGGDVVLAVAAVFGGVRGVDVTGGAALGADHLLAQVVHGHVGAFLHDDHLHAGGVAVGEVQHLVPLLRVGQAGQDHI